MYHPPIQTKEETLNYPNKANSNIKSISYNKFMRIMSRKKSVKGVAYYIVPNANKDKDCREARWTKEACIYKGFLYMRIPCFNQEEDQRKMVCIRIDRNYGWDKLTSAFIENNTLYPDW